MKKGLNFHLKVNFENLEFANVEKIEFAFSAENEKGSPIIKSCDYPNLVRYEEGTGAFLVPFNSLETADFPETFYMDTRITLKNSESQPQTQMVRLTMADSLFE